MNKRGQAAVEMVFIIPLLVMLAAGVCAVVYMCWQGVTVQQAANLAARIQGQERVAGGVSFAAIQQDNGIAGGGDSDPTKFDNLDEASLQGLQHVRASPTTVYGKIQSAVLQMFRPSEQQGVFVPMPHYGNVGISDQVKVVRVWKPPKFLSLDLKPITVVGTAYGGEDPHMYGLIRWGTTGMGGTKFWAQMDPMRPGQRQNLPNPHND